MTEHASARCCGERDDKAGDQRRASWHRWLLVCMAVAFTLCSSLPGEAVNGEPVAGQGAFRTSGACTTDFTISCDDRPEAGVVSCHMRRPQDSQTATKDEGLAINACVDGRVTAGVSQTEFLEQNVAIQATDFGEFVCGQEQGPSGLVNFCVVCDTFKNTGAAIGASQCVKIITDNPATPTPGAACGAFNVSNDTSGLCLSATQDLQQTFSDPQLGFTIGVDASDASKPGAKSLLVCSGRSWQCVTNRSVELALDAETVQQQETHGLINTGCCTKLASGAYYCSTKLTTCK